MEQPSSLFEKIRESVDKRIAARPASKVPTIFGPITTDQWPIWAKALNAMAKPEDKGIGDIVARMIGDEKSEAFKAWHIVTFGKPCNCTARRERWNRLYPLP